METSKSIPTPPSVAELTDLEFELDPILDVDDNHVERNSSTSTCTTYWGVTRCPTC